MKLELSSILGMHFRPSTGDCQSAVLHADFWPIYRAERDELRAAGITIGTDDDGTWHVRYNPRFDRTGAAELLPTLERAYMPKIEEARAARAEKERQTEINRENAHRDHEAWLEGEAVIIEDTIARARRLLDGYGDSVPGRAKLARLLSLPITRSNLSEIYNICEAADRKIAGRNAEAAEKTGGVDWSDEIVIRAVEILTEADDDHAETRNVMGWSAAHSSTGHWCYGALRDDRYRENALKLARLLVGHYVDQLSVHMAEVAPKGRAA